MLPAIPQPHHLHVSVFCHWPFNDVSDIRVLIYFIFFTCFRIEYLVRENKSLLQICWDLWKFIETIRLSAIMKHGPDRTNIYCRPKLRDQNMNGWRLCSRVRDNKSYIQNRIRACEILLASKELFYLGYRGRLARINRQTTQKVSNKK